MAMIQCTECYKLVSDTALHCPNCGNDIQRMLAEKRELIEELNQQQEAMRKLNMEAMEKSERRRNLLIKITIISFIVLVVLGSCSVIFSNKCDRCNGSGYYNKKTCYSCGGSGKDR